MTPNEVAAKLRNYNTWRRGNLEGMPQPDPREIGEAIDAAIEMIERLEDAESECLEQARLNGMGAEREAALIAKLEAAEKDNKVLRKALAEKVTSETMLRNLSVGNGSIHASFEGGAVHLLVDALSGQFSESGAENYLEMHFHSPATGPLVATVQRVNGKTPHQLREAAEKERDDVAMQLAQSEQGKRKISEEFDVLRARIAAIEKQEPVAWRRRSDYGWSYKAKPVNGLVLEPLYLAPGAQPAPSVPVDVITDYLMSISAHVAHQEEPQAQAEIRELLRMLAAPEVKQ